MLLDEQVSDLMVSVASEELRPEELGLWDDTLTIRDCGHAESEGQFTNLNIHIQVRIKDVSLQLEEDN